MSILSNIFGLRGAGIALDTTKPFILKDGKPTKRVTVGDQVSLGLLPEGDPAAIPDFRLDLDGVNQSVTAALYTTTAAGSLVLHKLDAPGGAIVASSDAVTVVALPVAPIINSFIFNAGGSGTPSSFTIDVAANPYDLTGIVEFLDGGGATLATLVVDPEGGNATITGVDAAAEGAVNARLTVTEAGGNLTATATEAIPPSTIDLTGAQYTSFSIADGAIDVPTSGTFLMNITENSFPGAGAVSFGGVSVDISAITVSGTQASVPYSGLANATTLEVTAPAGLFVDAKGNPVAALPAGVLSFTTAAAPNLLVDLVQPIEGNETFYNTTYPVAVDATGYDRLLTAAGIVAGVTTVDINASSQAPFVVSALSNARLAIAENIIGDPKNTTANIVFDAGVNRNFAGFVGVVGGQVTDSAQNSANFGATQDVSVTPTLAENYIVAVVAANNTAYTPPSNMGAAVGTFAGGGGLINVEIYILQGATAGTPFTASFTNVGSNRTSLALACVEAL